MLLLKPQKILQLSVGHIWKNISEIRLQRVLNHRLPLVVNLYAMLIVDNLLDPSLNDHILILGTADCLKRLIAQQVDLLNVRFVDVQHSYTTQV